MEQSSDSTQPRRDHRTALAVKELEEEVASLNMNVDGGRAESRHSKSRLEVCAVLCSCGKRIEGTRVHEPGASAVNKIEERKACSTKFHRGQSLSAAVGAQGIDCSPRARACISTKQENESGRNSERLTRTCLETPNLTSRSLADLRCPTRIRTPGYNGKDMAYDSDNHTVNVTTMGPQRRGDLFVDLLRTAVDIALAGITYLTRASPAAFTTGHGASVTLALPVTILIFGDQMDISMSHGVSTFRQASDGREQGVAQEEVGIVIPDTRCRVGKESKLRAPIQSFLSQFLGKLA
ncbi:hypothetical protein C8R44DRAFT_740302 [Mycena epipterygia]|nr:hypothetical protein C8R44DRAFT_740302 [Mycena epipterygia]